LNGISGSGPAFSSKLFARAVQAFRLLASPMSAAIISLSARKLSLSAISRTHSFSL
jgi:hypothetical protein